MKYAMLWLLGALLCAGCAAGQEAYYLDQEFGTAQLATWEKMIVPPAEDTAQRVPEGVEGLHSEAAMDIYHQSFRRGPSKTNVIQFGIVGN